MLVYNVYMKYMAVVSQRTGETMEMYSPKGFMLYVVI